MWYSPLQYLLCCKIERVGSGDEARIELAAYLDEPTGTESSSAQTPEDMFILNYT